LTNLLERVRATARRMGMHDVGVADVSALLREVYGVRPEAVAGLHRGIALATRLSDPVLDDIVDHPTQLYFFHYRRINIMLDQAAHHVAALLMEDGFRALPVPASQVLDWQNMRGMISHREVAALAGLGWRGRNNLLVHHRFGSRVRLVTVLTDAPLPVSEPCAGDCGKCRACVGVCPGRHIKDDPLAFDREGCGQTIRAMKNKYNIGQDICGVCVKACRGTRLEA
jgi:epoxyqueuosine reductase QueG